MRFHSLFVVFSVVAAATCTLPSAASAQTSASDTARVTELFKSGKVAFARGDMAEAERLFAQALSIRKSSDIAANLAQSELEQQKFRAAAEHFSWALANLLPSASDAQRKAVETGLARARAEVAVLRLEIRPDGADVLVGAQAVGKSPVGGGVYVEPGEVIISVKRDGFVAIDKRVMAGKGTEQAVEIELAPKPADAVASSASGPAINSGLAPDGRPSSTMPSDRAEAKSLVPAFVATGAAVAAGVAGLVLTLKANGKEDDANALRDRLGALGGCDGHAPEADEADCADLKEQREGVDSSRNLATGSFVVGGVAAVVAGYFYWDALSHRSSARARRSRPLLGLLPSVEMGRADTVKLGVSGTF